MKKSFGKLVLGVLLSLSAVAAFAKVWVPKGTQVTLAFDQAVNSRHVQVGDTIKMHVQNDVVVDGRTILRAGTPVTGEVSKVRKQAHFGVNAQMQIAMLPVRGIELQPRMTGKMSGSRPDHAAEISVASALVLGPLGLVGGYFVVGKPVHIKPGDTFDTEVAHGLAVP